MENIVQKYTFIHENNFNNTKITFESGAVSLDQLLTDFSDFLRGAGFQINGYLDVVSYDEEPENYSDHYDTAEEMPENCCVSEYDDGPLWQDTKWQDDEELDYDHPEANWGGWKEKE